MKFSKKKVLCESHELHSTIRATQLEWLQALLLRMKLDPKKVEAGVNDQHSSSQSWRDWLVMEAGLNILKQGDEIIVEKHYRDKPKRLMGRWERPEIVRINEGGRYRIELRLKYWQLI